MTRQEWRARLAVAIVVAAVVGLFVLYAIREAHTAGMGY